MAMAGMDPNTRSVGTPPIETVSESQAASLVPVRSLASATEVTAASSAAEKSPGTGGGGKAGNLVRVVGKIMNNSYFTE